MLQSIELQNVLFLDIETVPSVYKFSDMKPLMQDLWSSKTLFIQQREGKTAEELYDKAGIYSEFGKVICISTGFIQFKDKTPNFRVKSFYGYDEKKILEDFALILRNYFKDPKYFLCGHNAKEFDLPFIARRMLINGVDLPPQLDMAGKKPWEVKHLDTMELWKFGDYKHYTSLNLLAAIFNIPTPKDDISGADVSRVFYEENDVERIKTYCEKDTLTVAQLMLRFTNQSIITPENFIIA